MTDLNKPAANKFDPKANSPAVEPELHPQQVSIKAWSQKLLVALLCLASFYGGWKSYESSMANQCFASGGQIVEGEKTLLCKLS